MLRYDIPTAPVVFETPEGRVVAGGQGQNGTRLRFSQVSASLSVRWCSASLKVDVADRALRGQDRFLNRRTLVVTGERAEESPAGARYAAFEPHRTDTRNGTRRRRHVDHWRPVHQWSEAEVWAILERWCRLHRQAGCRARATRQPFFSDEPRILTTNYRRSQSCTEPCGCIRLITRCLSSYQTSRKVFTARQCPL